MDLGFTFSRDKLSAYMISIVPGLQRSMEKVEDDDEERKVEWPYLSEARLINSPDPPLLTLCTVPQGTNCAADMKKLIKFWAKSVAMLVNEQLD